MLRMTTFIGLLLLSLTGQAAEFSVSPMLINVESEGGTSEPFEISITGKADGRINLSVFRMEQLDSGHMNFMETTSESQTDPRDWIQFSTRNFQIKKDESTVIQGLVKTPRTARGTYLAAVMVEEDTGDVRNNIVIKVRYAVILNITIGAPKGRMVTAFNQVNIVELDDKSFVEGYFTSEHTHLGFLQSTVQIRGADRRLIGKLDLKTDSAWQRGDTLSRVYPGARVRLFAELPRNLASGDYELLVRNQFNGRSQPLSRQTVSHVSTLIDDSLDRALIAVTEERIEVKPMRSGMSLTQIPLHNPTSEPVTVMFPESSSAEGILEYTFIPASMTLQPGAKRRVMLRQRHASDANVASQSFKLQASNPSGRREEVVVSTYPGAAR
jgi:hypothetical protein